MYLKEGIYQKLSSKDYTWNFSMISWTDQSHMPYQSDGHHHRGQEFWRIAKMCIQMKRNFRISDAQINSVNFLRYIRKIAGSAQKSLQKIASYLNLDP